MELDLDVIVAKWLNACGSCDAGLPASCSCSADDPRPALGALVEEVQRLRAQRDKPCGECHPCLYWADQTWRAAGRTPPDMPLWDEKVMELAHAEAELEEERRSAAALREQIQFLTFERDRLRDELGAACEELRDVGRTVTRSGRRLAFEDGGSDGR